MLTSESDTGGESSMSGIVSGLAVFFLLSLSILVLGSITYNKEDRNEGSVWGSRQEEYSSIYTQLIDPGKMKPLGPQATILLSTHRLCRLFCPHGKFFRYQFFRLHSDKFCQGDFFSKNSMEEPLLKKKSIFYFLIHTPLAFSFTLSQYEETKHHSGNQMDPEYSKN